MRDWKNAEIKRHSWETICEVFGSLSVRESVENDLAYRLTMANQELKKEKSRVKTLYVISQKINNVLKVRCYW